ncbi:CRISPR-associated protein, APE2256 family [hot springs metagenome]|uniref:CRISPR-associated protein, APE2256 family n=1 Tax=hot springs metagenome TaxID=433727 RepID=A0A5J4L6H9_9ZZZZ
MKKVITTVGTSIFENYLNERNDILTHYKALKDKHHKDWDNQQDRINIIRKSIISWSKHRESASAELKSLLKIQEYFKDDIDAYLLSTDSITSRLAAEVLREWFIDNKHIKINFDPSNDVISKLQVANYDDLKSEGLPNLINRINLIAGVGTDSPGYFKDIIFNISGGYKAVIPYLTIMAAVNACQIAYIFEDTDTLILIPPLPVRIDFDIFEIYSDQIALLDKGIENYKKVKESNFQEFALLEQKGMVEQVNNYAFLSPVGKIFYEKIKGQYFLFYAPDDVYHELIKQDDIIRILKTKFRDKNHRESKTEKKGEHYVYDDGNNPNRIYYFEDHGRCYIYKTFQSEEDARDFIESSIDKNTIIKKSKLRRLEV